MENVQETQSVDGKILPYSLHVSAIPIPLKEHLLHLVYLQQNLT
jgi:hypothetical protein